MESCDVPSLKMLYLCICSLESAIDGDHEKAR